MGTHPIFESDFDCLTEKKIPNLEYIYFGIHGRGILPRMILDMGNVPYTNTQPKDFAAMKPELPLGQLPVLKVDGKMFCQSLAIARYCSKLAKLPVLNNEEALASDMIMDTCTEVFEKAVPAAFATRNAIPEDQPEKRNQVFYDTAKNNLVGELAKLERGLNYLKTGDNVVPGKVSLADVAVTNLYILAKDPKFNAFEAKYPNVMENAKKYPYMPF